jgi:hypothetical protein
MDIKTVEKHFARMGARVQVGTPANRFSQPFGIDIGTDKRGEFFDIQVQQPEAIEMLTLDIRPEMRHLLLMVRGGGSGRRSICAATMSVTGLLPVLGNRTFPQLYRRWNRCGQRDSTLWWSAA